MSARGIPTTFQGINYRSLAEARWASLMTNLGMRFQFEPFEGNGYIPDFLVLGDAKILLEVKGGEFDLGSLAGHIDKIDAGLDDVWDGDVLLVGGAPIIDDIASRCAGLMRQDGDWEPALWMKCLLCGNWGWHHETGNWRCYPCGHHDGDHYLGAIHEGSLRDLWSAALNDTKWQGAR